MTQESRQKRSSGSVVDPKQYAALLEQLAPVGLEPPGAVPGAPVPQIPNQVVSSQQQLDANLQKPAPQIQQTEQPPLGTYLTEPSKPDGGWLSGFINDPKTIAAAVFGLAALNSNSDNLAGAFLEGLGAVGAAQETQRERMQQEFENRLAERKSEQGQQTIDTATFTAQQVAERSKEQTALARSGIDLEGFNLALKERGLNLQQLSQQQQERLGRANVALGQQTNQTRLLAALMASESEANRTAAGERSENDRLLIELLKPMLSEDSYFSAQLGGFAGTPEQFRQLQYKRLGSLAETFPRVKALLSALPQPALPGLGGAPAKPTKPTYNVGQLREGIGKAGVALGLADPNSGVTGVVLWKDEETEKLLGDANPEELQQTFSTLQSQLQAKGKDITYASGPGWAVTDRPKEKERGKLLAKFGGVPTVQAGESTGAPAESQPSQDAARARAAGIGPGGFFRTKDGKVWQLSPDGLTVIPGEQAAK